MKKQPLESKESAQSLLSPNFLEIQRAVFEQRKNGKIYIGGELIAPILRSVLRDEAENIETTRLWEILNASILNEAYDIALKQSKDFNQVEFAKALHHWSHFFLNVIHILAKED